MAENSAISWTDHTFNPWIGCTKVSPGCANCYAATQDNLRKWTPDGWGKGKPRKLTSAANWLKVRYWNKLALATNTRPRVFCASLADWLDDEVPIEWLADLIDLIRVTPNLDWLLLTKRPENFAPRLQAILDMIPKTGIDLKWAMIRTRITVMLHGWQYSTYIAPEIGIENYWIGTTVEDQARADERIPALLDIPAKVRFLSCEPLLEPVDIISAGQDLDGQYSPRFPVGIHWVICGGESGAGFRPFDPEWARILRDQCKDAGVAFHMKQMGGLRPSTMPPIPDDLLIREYPTP